MAESQHKTGSGFGFESSRCANFMKLFVSRVAVGRPSRPPPATLLLCEAILANTGDKVAERAGGTRQPADLL